MSAEHPHARQLNPHDRFLPGALETEPDQATAYALW